MTVQSWTAQRKALLARWEEEKRAAPSEKRAAARPAPAAKPTQRVARDAESTPVTMRMLKALMSEMGDGVGSRLRSLSERIRVLEQRPAGMRYSGTWAPGEYAKDQAVTMSGGLWVAKETTTDRPGTSNQWQLAVKSPR